MAGHSSRKDRLFYFALHIAEEEAKSSEITQQTEEHGQIIQSKYNLLVSNLSCLGDITAAMHEKEKLTLKELQDIQHLHSTPIRANEELLSIIASRPRDVYDFFLSLIRETNQLHLYQILVSGEDTCDKTNGEYASEHKDFIRRNFRVLAEKLDTENGLIFLLYQKNVLTVREKELVYLVNDTFQKNEHLLGLLSRKSSRDFEIFLETLDELGQGHLSKILRKPKDSTTVPSAQTAVSISKEPMPNIPHESGQKPDDVLPLSSGLVAIPEALHKPGQKLIPLPSVLTPVQFEKSDTEKSVNHRRAGGATFQARQGGLEPRLKVEIAFKVTSVSLLYLDKPNLKTCFQILLQECLRIRKETIATNVETQGELEQLRENVSQYSASESLNEFFRSELHSVLQELANERFERNKDRMHFEEKINKLTIDLDDEKRECKRLYEEKLLSNTIVKNMEESLKKAESDKQCLQQQLQEQSFRLATCTDELQMSKDTFKESDRKMALLITERDKLLELCETLRWENTIRNELESPIIQSSDNNLDLAGCFKKNEGSLEVAVEEASNLPKSSSSTREELSAEPDRISKPQTKPKIKTFKGIDDKEGLDNLAKQLDKLDESVVPRYIKVMQENFNIVMALYLGESFLGHLFQERVLTRDQYDDIQLLRKQPGGKAEVLDIIMNALQRTGDKAAEPFLSALLDPGSRLDALAMLIDPKRAKQLIRRRDNPGD